MFFFFFSRHAFAEMIVRKCFSPSTSFSSRASVLVTSLWDECRHGFSSASALLHSSSSYLCSFFLLSLLSFFCSFFFFGTNNLKRKQNKKNERNRRQTPKKKKKKTHRSAFSTSFFLFISGFSFSLLFYFQPHFLFFFRLRASCSIRKVPINRVVYCSSSLSEGSRDLLLLLFFFCS